MVTWNLAPWKTTFLYQTRGVGCTTSGDVLFVGVDGTCSIRVWEQIQVKRRGAEDKKYLFWSCLSFELFGLSLIVDSGPIAVLVTWAACERSMFRSDAMQISLHVFFWCPELGSDPPAGRTKPLVLGWTIRRHHGEKDSCIRPVTNREFTWTDGWACLRNPHIHHDPSHSLEPVYLSQRGRPVYLSKTSEDRPDTTEPEAVDSSELAANGGLVGVQVLTDLHNKSFNVIAFFHNIIEHNNFIDCGSRLKAQSGMPNTGGNCSYNLFC